MLVERDVSPGRQRKGVTMPSLAGLIAFTLSLAVLTACGSSRNHGAAASPPAANRTQAGCVDIWNTHEDASNREQIASDSERWRVEVSTWVVNHPASDSTGEGCSYLFATDERWTSFSGMWRTDGTLAWQDQLTQGGARTPEQRIQLTSLNVQTDGSLG